MLVVDEQGSQMMYIDKLRDMQTLLESIEIGQTVYSGSQRKLGRVVAIHFPDDSSSDSPVKLSVHPKTTRLADEIYSR